MRRLYLQVYLAFLSILLVFAVLVAAAWHHGALASQDQDTLDGAAVLIAERLPSGFGYDWTGMTDQDLPPAGEETVASIFALVFP